MFAAPDEPRAHYESLHQVLGTLSRDDFEARCAARDRAFHDQGITFSHSGEERPFPLDLVPRIIDADEWAVVESGVRQRVLALERFLGDVYGPGEILADGVVPRRLVASSSHFHRCVHGVDPAGGVRVHVAGVDLVRDGAGRLPGARGQPAHAVGHLLRDREPSGDDPRVPRAVRQPPHPPGRRLSAAPPRGVALHRAAGRRRPGRRRAHARHPQRRVLRALVPRPPDGRRAGRGPRPRVPRPARLHAHDRRRAARRRGVPAHRRRVPRPGALPPRLGARVRRHPQRRARRQRHHRQRARQRRRRRQGRLSRTCPR